MAVQTLNPVQVAFVNETIRPMVESLVKMKFRLDAFNLDYDNQQTPIVEDGDDLGDGVDGLVPRVGAPVWTGTKASQMRTVTGNMAATLSGATLDAMIALMVRDLAIVTGQAG